MKRKGIELFSILIIGLCSTFAFITQFTKVYSCFCTIEYFAYLLNNIYFVYILIPVLILFSIHSKSEFILSYIVLLRYHSRKTYLLNIIKNDIIKAFTVTIGLLLVHLLVVGFYGFSGGICGGYLTIDFSKRILLEQLVNILIFYSCFIAIVDILKVIVVNHKIIEIIALTALLIDVVIYKLQIEKVLQWTPWGHILISIAGYYVSGYRIYLLYWLQFFILALLLAELFYAKGNLLQGEDYQIHK